MYRITKNIFFRMDIRPYWIIKKFFVYSSYEKEKGKK